MLTSAILCIFAPTAAADSSSPRLAAYYDSFLAICGGSVHAWQDDGKPVQVMDGARKVGVGKNNRYVLTEAGSLIMWDGDPLERAVVADGAAGFFAGRTGLFIVDEDGRLWERSIDSFLGLFGETVSGEAKQIADNVLTGSIGDSANYYIDRSGGLYVKGKAHRGQYGDGKLTETDTYVQTFSDVVQVVAHTGHALILRNDGTVWGTGGNKYGPLGEHGIGDKADRWGRILDGAKAIATGSTHSLAILEDDSLWIWGRKETLKPTQIMTDVTAVAAGDATTIALSDGMLWQWETGSKPEAVMPCAR